VDETAKQETSLKTGGQQSSGCFLPLNGVISQKIELFINIGVRTSNPTTLFRLNNYHHFPESGTLQMLVFDALLLDINTAASPNGRQFYLPVLCSTILK
jgi:hypothetical protein